jgi:hypothetical protein
MAQMVRSAPSKTTISPCPLNNEENTPDRCQAKVKQIQKYKNTKTQKHSTLHSSFRPETILPNPTNNAIIELLGSFDVPKMPFTNEPNELLFSISRRPQELFNDDDTVMMSRRHKERPWMVAYRLPLPQRKEWLIRRLTANHGLYHRPRTSKTS